VICHGQRGAILWGSGDAAVLSAWSVVRDEQYQFTLSARIERADSYRLRQLPLRFVFASVIKPAGLWCFPVLPKTMSVNGAALTASLGPPERGR
jgi:hypothetical protein